MIRIRGASGLGDSVYLRAIAEHFARQGDQVIACSNFPDIFKGSPVTPEPFRRTDVDLVAHYVTGKTRRGTTQWQDVCISAGALGEVPFRFDWARGSSGMVERVRDLAGDLPVVLVHGGRVPMNRTDGFGAKIMPAREAFVRVLGRVGAGCFLVAVGRHVDRVYGLPCDLDLTDATTVPDLLDLFQDCDGVVGQCSFAVPMAEVFDRPLLAVWSSEGLADREPYVRAITPEKVLSKASSRYVVDDVTPEEMIAAAAAFERHITKGARCVS